MDAARRSCQPPGWTRRALAAVIIGVVALGTFGAPAASAAADGPVSPAERPWAQLFLGFRGDPEQCQGGPLGTGPGRCGGVFQDLPGRASTPPFNSGAGTMTWGQRPEGGWLLTFVHTSDGATVQGWLNPQPEGTLEGWVVLDGTAPWGTNLTSGTDGALAELGGPLLIDRGLLGINVSAQGFVQYTPVGPSPSVSTSSTGSTALPPTSSTRRSSGGVAAAVAGNPRFTG